MSRLFSAIATFGATEGLRIVSPSVAEKLDKVDKGVEKIVKAPVDLAVNTVNNVVNAGDKIIHGENVVKSIGEAGRSITSDSVQTVFSPLDVITQPIPSINNTVNAVESMVDRGAMVPINTTESSINAPIKTVQDICDGKNAVLAIGQSLITPSSSALTETVQLSKVVYEEVKSILEGKESQRRKNRKFKFGRRILIADVHEINKNLLLGVSWQSAHLTYTPDRFTDVIEAHTWEQVFTELINIVKNKGKLSEIQYLGHGVDGCPIINSTSYFTLDFMNTTATFQEFVNLKPFLTNGTGLFWFRTCLTMNGDAGRQFATELVKKLGVRVAGHTVIISSHQVEAKMVQHPGFQVLAPGQNANWADKSGITLCALDWSPNQLSPIYVS